MKMRLSLGSKVGGALLALLALGCGQTQDPERAAAPGSGGMSGSGGGGGTSGSVDAPGGEGGAPPTPEPGYGAALLAAVPTPAPPSGSLDGSEQVEQQLIPAWVSDDGSLIIGDSFTTYTRADGTVAYSDSQAFTWTEDDGVEPLLLPFGADLLNACVAADGSAALVTAFPTMEATQAAYRWTRRGLVSLPAPAGGVGVGLDMCDAAVTQAALSTNGQAYVWTLQGDAGPIYEAPAPANTTATQVLVSREGKLAVVNATSKAGTAPYRFDFTGENHPALGAAEDAGCAASALSDNGAQVIGVCQVGLVATGFYFDGEAFSAFEQLIPLRISADGNVVWGESTGARDVGFWRADSGELELCQLADTQWTFVDSSADGESAFVTVGAPEVPVAQRCSQGGGVETLPLLPGQAYSRISAISRDGALQVGEQLMEGEMPGTTRAVAVLWDAKGARDVLAELKNAHVQVPAERLQLARVWHDAEEARILAKAIIPGQPPQDMLLRLPIR